MFVDNSIAHGVGKSPFQTVTHFDAQRSVVFCNEKQDAVVNAFSPQFPLVRHSNCELFDALRLGCGNNQNGHLGALLFLKLSERVFQVALLGRIERAGQIRNPALKGRNRLLGRQSPR